MADESSDTDNITDEKHSHIDTLSEIVDDGSVINDEHPSMWWLNIRRRCHKHGSIKRNRIRRKH